jgi:multiple sugar transport system permease protein/raffinose/stachyose/melibiose transport system permease protein
MTAPALGFAQVRRLPLVLFVILYTVVTGGPLLWVATMSLRTTAEIFKNPYGLPSPRHWEKFADAWTKSNYGTYFWNSTIVVVIAVALVTRSARWPRIASPATAFAAIGSCAS